MFSAARIDRIAHVDGLRGIAVLAVVAVHAAAHSRLPSSGGDSPIAFILRNGCHGVDLFFVLSGFCLAYPPLSHLHAEGRTRFNIAGYGARRAVRILPPYYAAIGVLWLLAMSLGWAHVVLPQSMDSAAAAPRGILNQMLFIGHSYLAAPFWTLAIEFRWYFIFPLVLWVWTRSRSLFALIAVTSLIFSGGPLRSIDLFFLPTFMLGIVAADVYIRKSRTARLALIAFPPSLAVALASTAHGGWYWTGAGPYWGISMFFLVVAAGASGVLRRLLSSRALIYIGVTSYGIYLVHEPIVELADRAFVAISPIAQTFAGGALGVAVGIAFSFAAERPFLKNPLRNSLIQPIERFMGGLLGVCHARYAALTTASPQMQNAEGTKAVP